jgi:hypothetical protein
VHNKWGVYGVTFVLGFGSITPIYAFNFNPGRWMDHAEWFGNGRPLPPPPPMRPQSYAPGYRLPAPAHAYSAPTMAPTTPATSRTTVPQPSPITPPAPVKFGGSAAAPLKFKESAPAGNKLKWTNEKAIIDRSQKDRSFSFAPEGYLQDSK